MNPSHIKITLCIGLGYTSSGETIDSLRARDAVSILRDCATRLAGGCTSWRAEGDWKDNEGKTVREPVLVLEVTVPVRAEEVAREIGDLAKRTLDQTCVAVTFTPCNFCFF